MKKIVLVISIALFSLGFAQKKWSHFDSLKLKLEQLSIKDKIKTINKIPNAAYVAEVEKAEQLFKLAENLAIKSNDSVALGEIVFKLGQLKTYQNKMDESIALSLRAIKILENKNEIAKVGMAYGGLGYNLKRNNLERSLKYMRKGIALLEKANDLKNIHPVYDNYGVVLTMVQKNDSALFFQKKSLSIKKTLKDSVGLGYGYANIANTFAEKKNFKLAKIYVDSSSIIRNKIADNYGITVNYVQKAEILVLENKFKEAIENFKICAVLSRKYKYKHLEQYCYENLAKSYLEFKDYKNAYLYKEQFQTIKDSSNNVQTNNKIEELQIQFETEKKEKLLVEANSNLLAKEAKIKRKNLLLYSALGLAFLLGLIGYLVYKQQSTKQKQLVKENELKQALIKIENQNNLQEQRLAISKDLHDNIGSQLTFIISSLDNLKYFEFTKDKLYTKFDSIGTFTRTTITDLRDTIWAMNKEEITFEDLKTRTTNFIESAKASLLGIHFDFNYPTNQKEIVLNSKQGIEIYRIIQEAVNNAVKHAKASKITVDFKNENNQVIIAISDNGIGFDKETIENGNGLNSMQKRASTIDATLDLISSEKGTTIRLNFKP
ncbi:ATP-binding protein [Flavobacterium sp.]|uniref:tetratricopeptide repeat-containing sensor histidine kinase n=1 Tax=Flavobacterium sp. TaxID=239 RepID=UPI003F6A3172